MACPQRVSRHCPGGLEPGVAYDWELFDEKGSHMYSVADGLASSAADIC